MVEQSLAQKGIKPFFNYPINPNPGSFGSYISKTSQVTKRDHIRSEGVGRNVALAQETSHSEY